MSQTAYIAIGSNLGRKVLNCRKAAQRMGLIAGCRVVSQSGLFRTEPVGVHDQDWYVNGVVEIATDLPPRVLLETLLAVEAAMGRERKEKWSARVIDLDILLYGQAVIEEADLKVPHPLMHLRRFVMVPINRLAPQLVHPVLKRTMAEILAGLPEEGQAVFEIEGEGI
jgi:2-amino-4-hydroxy-6-hydroxymethyldihydropteridine diphosphokinase